MKTFAAARLFALALTTFVGAAIAQTLPTTTQPADTDHVQAPPTTRAARIVRSFNGARPYVMPDHVDLSVAPGIRWQFADPSILRVMADTSNRLWYQRRPNPTPPSIDQAKELIAREFKSPDPQLSDIRPLLFEPNGRAWFLVYGQFGRAFGDDRATILGYDGTTFVERPSPRKATYNDRVFNSGQVEIDRSCAYADGAALFASAGSVTLFDGTSWSSRDFVTGDRRTDSVRLYPEPDGKGVVVAAGSIDGLWHWRDKKWTAIKVARISTNPNFSNNGERGMPLDIAPMPDGIWLLTQQNLTFVPWFGQEMVTTEALIAQLRDDSFKVREAATASLIARGHAIDDDLQAALARNQGNESRYRLEFILRELDNSSSRPPTKTPVGNYLISGPLFMAPLANGECLLGVQSIDDATGHEVTTRPAAARPAAAMPRLRNRRSDLLYPGGVLKIDKEGHVTLLGGEDLLGLFVETGVGIHQPIDLTSQPFLINHGTAVWVLHRAGGRLSLLDLASGKILQQSSLPAAQAILASTADRTLFIRTQTSVVAYQPSSPETRTALPIACTFDGGYLTKTGDGAAWAFDRKGQLIRWDGTHVRPVVRGDTTGYFDCVITGHDALLVETRDKWQLITPTEVTSADNLEDFIAANPSLFTQFSVQQTDVRRGNGLFALQSDAAGNLWLLNTGKQELKIFSAGKWIDAVDPVIKAGNRSGKISAMVRIGDGSKMYIADTTYRYGDPTPRSFLASCVDGQLTLQALPETQFNEIPTGNHMTPDGGLWLTSNDEKEGRTSAILLTDKGIVQRVPDFIPLACDAAGNLWGVSPVRDPSAPWSDPANPPLVLVRGLQHLPVRMLGQTRYPFAQLISAPNGHIYVDTELGLQELRPATATAPSATTPGDASPLFYIPDQTAPAVLVGKTNGSDTLIYESRPPAGIQTIVVRLPPG